MLESLKNAPYYDKSSEEREKGYTQLLAVPGRVAQAREITQIQSTMKDIIKSIGDSLLSDGDVLEGCKPTPAEMNSSKDQIKYIIDPGKVYISGMVLPVEKSEVWVSTKGNDSIGIKLVEEIVDYDVDPDLTDPASGHANYKMPGCARLKSKVEVTTLSEDPTAKELVKTIDGVVALENVNPEYEFLNKTLARRTYDESGSYVVEGFGVRLEPCKESPNPDRDKSDYYDIVVDSGKAYVRGYELKTPAARRISVERSIESTEGIPLTSIRYIEGSDKTVIEDDKLIYQSITSLVGDVKHKPLVASGNPLDIEASGEVIIESVKISTTTQEYVLGEHYDIDIIPGTGGAQITWRSSVSIPAEYTVNYNYKYEFDPNSQYSFHTSGGEQYILWYGDVRPIGNSYLRIEYRVYKARKDLLYINEEGNIIVEKGNPDLEGREILPNNPLGALPLAYISSPPAGVVDNDSNLNIILSTVGLTRFTMEDIHGIVQRIKTIEYDQANLSLNEEAKTYGTSGDMKGIFTDSLVDFSKISFEYSNPSWNARIDTVNKICHLPVLSEYFDLLYNEVSSTSEKSGNIITLSKRGEPISVREQLKATDTFTVNPYSQAPHLPEITLSPSVDSFIDVKHLEAKIDYQETQSYKDLPTKWVNTSQYRLRNQVVSTAYGSTERVPVSSTDSGDQLFLEVPQAYMRQRVITVKGSYFSPDSKEIVCTIDGVKADLTIGGTGSQYGEGSINPDSNGNFEATFTVPEKIPTGAREVRLEALQKAEGFRDVASALYYGTHSIQYYQRTITVVTNIVTERIQTVYRYVDPIGQTFVLDNTTILDGVGLYFAKFSEDIDVNLLAPITCEIREVSNGTITSESSIAYKTLKASDINLPKGDNPDYGELETVFNFESPVLLTAGKEYAFVVRSTSPSYKLWVAELGKNDITSERDGVAKPVLYNPYLQGNMMSSSNNSSWTVHQTTDLKFRLLAHEYEQENHIIFDKITSTEGFSDFYLKSEEDIPEHTSVVWSYSLDGINYSPVAKESLRLLDSLRNEISFRATISRDPANTTLSPMIVADSIGVELSKYESVKGFTWSGDEGKYYTKSVNPNSGNAVYSDEAAGIEVPDMKIESRDDSILCNIDGLPIELFKDAATAEMITWYSGSANYYTKAQYSVGDNLYSDTSLLNKASTIDEVKEYITLDGSKYYRDSLEDSGAGWYVSRRVTNLDPYNNVDVIIDKRTVDSTTDIEVWVNVDDNDLEENKLLKATLVKAGIPSSYGWEDAVTYRVFTGDDITSTKCRILVKLTSTRAQSTPAFRKLRAIMSEI